MEYLPIVLRTSENPSKYQPVLNGKFVFALNSEPSKTVGI